MKQIVLLPEQIDAAGTEYLLERGYELRYCSKDPRDVLENCHGCSAAITRNVPITRDMMLSAPSLRVIARHGIGVDLIDTSCAQERGIWVTYAPESNGNAVAEQVLGALIACARSLTGGDRMIREGRYAERVGVAGIELAGKTLGVIGFGRIGRLTAQKAALGLGMKISAYDPFGPGKEEPFPVNMESSLEQLLQDADVVTLHLPLTESTRGLIGEKEFELMKSTAILINYARGPLVNIPALAAALRENRLFAAALDVFGEEPVQPWDEVCSLPRTILTPHTAAFTKESLQKMALHAAITVDEVLRGTEPRWFVVRGR